MFAIAETPQERREGTNIYTISTNSDEVRGNAVQLAHQHADVFHTFRDILVYTQHFLNAHYPGMAVVHAGQVIHPVGKRYSLLISKRFGMIFEATVQITDMRDHLFNNLA